MCLSLLVDGKPVVGVMGCPNLPHSPSAPKPTEGGLDGFDKSTLGTIYVCVAGQGSFQRTIQSGSSGSGSGSEETRISMRQLPSSSGSGSSAAEKLQAASFCESVEAGHSSHSTNARIAELLGITQPSVRMDSQAKYASIARGDGDVYLRLPVGDGSYEEKIWVSSRRCLGLYTYTLLDMHADCTAPL